MKRPPPGTGRFPGLLRRRLAELWAAARTRPSRRVWRQCALLYGLFLLCAAPLATAADLLQPGLPSLPVGVTLALLLYLVLVPALTEELFFRGLLLPRVRLHRARSREYAMAGLSLTVFVLWHPINGLLLRPAAREIFTHPGFLACAALLGATCTAAYWLSRSIWPPVLLHWITVALWVVLLGGFGMNGTRLNGPEPQGQTGKPPAVGMAHGPDAIQERPTTPATGSPGHEVSMGRAAEVAPQYESEIPAQIGLEFPNLSTREAGRREPPWVSRRDEVVGHLR